MEPFRTVFNIPEHPAKLDYTKNILSLGSCFSEHMGEKLTHYKFPIQVNPFGILYNPESIAQSIDFLLENKKFSPADLFEHQGVWNSFYHHSRYSDTHPDRCLNTINTSLEKASRHLAETQFLFLTFGTSWVYEFKKTGKIVSNCHKIPASEFKRYQLSIVEIVARYRTLIQSLNAKIPHVQIVFTVSPVRHMKDGASENQLSKATLIMAVHQLVSEFSNATYFPSYEIMMDDLRDYRFYNDDMVHPSPLAIHYIWGKFEHFIIADATKKLMQEIDKIKQAINHRPFQPESEPHQKFLKTQLKKIQDLENKHKSLDFSEEKKLLQGKLL